MKDFETIFAYYCANPYALESLDYFVDYEVDANNEVVSLEIYDSEYYDLFPITDRLGEFIGEFKKLKRLEIEGEYVIKDLSHLSDLQALEFISIESMTKIDSLEFVKNMMNLKSLYLASSDIKNIDALADKKQLTNVSLPYAQIQDITALHDLLELVWVNFYNNAIENIDGLKRCQKLTSINVGNNQITSIAALQTMPELTYLNITNNKIEDLTPIESLDKLNRIDAANNRIKNIIFLANLKELTFLNIANNKVTAIGSINECRQLSYLNIADNLIENIDFLTAKKSLKELHISNNPIRSISVLSRLSGLNNLYMSHLKTAYFYDGFQFQSKLTKLNLSHCNIENVAFLSNQNKITELNLSNNQISHFGNPEYFPVLEYLNLEHNQIHTVFPICHFNALRTVDLRGNPFGNKLFIPYTNSNYRYYDATDIKAEELGTKKDLEKLMADYYLENEDFEAALAYFYLDNVDHHPQIQKQHINISIYYLKYLHNRNSPLFYNIRKKIFQTLSYNFSSKAEQGLRDYYSDIVQNIDKRTIAKPSEKIYFIQLHLHRYSEYISSYDNRLIPTLNRLIAEEKEVLKPFIIKPKAQKRYQSKPQNNELLSPEETVGCIAFILFMLVLFVMILTDSISGEALQIMVFIMAIIRIGQHFYYKYN